MSFTWQALRDRAELQDCMTRYAQGVDQRSWPLYDSAFHADGQVEVPGYMDGALGFVAFREMLADAFDRLRLSGQHLLGNLHAEVNGDSARTVTEFLATTLEQAAGGASREVTPGLYIDDFRREGGEWRIVRHVIVRKAANGAVLPFVSPIAEAVRTTLATPWLPGATLHPGHS